MSKTTIKVENISKKYTLGMIGSGSLRESISLGASKLFGKKTEEISQKEFWALRDINFEVKQGEVVGIIGKNGAGKSTLLKVLSRITQPTTGQITIDGRIASLLEVGTGFHPELSGRENIFLNGAILGMDRKEIKSKFDEIVEFSGVEKFLDTPVKRYSSGMYVRLAFAVAAHLEPEILVIDEVLSVGDAEFQKKCLGKMNDVAKGGRTVLFVSHNMAAVRDLCSSGIVLNHGEVVFSGKTEDSINYYLESLNEDISTTGEIEWPIEKAKGKEEMRLLAVRLKNEEGKVQSVFRSDKKIKLEIEYLLVKDIGEMRINVQIRTKDGSILFATSTHDIEPKDKLAGRHICHTWLPANFFNQSNYKVAIQAGIPQVKQLLKIDNYLDFSIEHYLGTGSRLNKLLPGYTAPVMNWETKYINNDAISPHKE